MSTHRTSATLAVAALALTAVTGVAAPSSAAARTCFGRHATIVGTGGDDDLHGTKGRDVIIGLGGNDEIEGREGKDLVCAGDGNDQVRGNTGRDKIDGGPGRDYLSGGDGRDVVRGAAGDDRVQGDDHADRATGGPGRDYVDGGDGDDEVEGGGDRDYVSGGQGVDDLGGGGDDDRLRGDSGRDHLSGDAGNDALDGGQAADLLLGGDGDDTLDGSHAADLLRGEDGDDTLTGDDFWGDVDAPAWDDVLDGGPGSDMIQLWRHPQADGGVTVDLTAGTATGQGADELDSIESVFAYSEQADTIIGSDADNTFWTVGGDDATTGLGGDDTFRAEGGDDHVDGGPGSDTITFEAYRVRVTANLQSGIATSNRTGVDMLAAVENITGSQHNDVLTGNDSENLLRGMNGQDTLRGMAADDVLRGGLNSSSLPDRVDKLSGGPGDDLIDGSDVGLKPEWDARDQVDYSTAAVPVTVDLAAGTATGEGTDTLVMVEDAVGSVHDDTLLGTSGPNELNGNAGNDVLEARDGDDELEGSPGDDTMDGGPGRDSLQFNLAPSGVVVDLGAGTATGQGTDVVLGLEDVVGTLFADEIRGDDGPNVVDGAFGEDVVAGAGGDDVLYGDRGDDALSGGDGDDVLDPGLGDDQSNGDAGNDHLWSTPGTDAHDGGAGRDLLDFSLEAVGVDVDLEAGTAVADDPDTVAAVEDVLGSDYADRIRGNAASNRIDAAKEIDEVDGRGGDDVLFGGSDRSRDFLAGGDGSDTVDYTGAARRVVADLQAGFSEGTGNDVLISLENIVGSAYPDDLRGDELANVFSGMGGDDVMDMRGGDDVADGGDGTDTADGGDGTDQCTVEFAYACE